MKITILGCGGSFGSPLAWNRHGNIDLSNKILAKKIIVEKILDLIKEDLRKLGIVFDSFISEKSIHDQGILDKVLVCLNKSCNKLH